MSTTTTSRSWISRLPYLPSQSFIPTEKALFGTVLFPAETKTVTPENYQIALRAKLLAIEETAPGAMEKIVALIPVPELSTDPYKMFKNPEFRAWLRPLMWDLPHQPFDEIPAHQTLFDLDELMMELEA